MDTARTGRSSWLYATSYVAGSLLCGLAFVATGGAHHGFDLPQSAVSNIDERELAFFGWYALWGSLSTLCLTRALVLTRLPEALLAAFARATRSPARSAGFAAALMLCAALLARAYVLHEQPVTDDESTYAFEAQTLLHGRVLNPAPPDAALYWNQFIVVREHGWYGQYPVGHPLLLAAGEALHLRRLVVPLIGALTLLLSFAIGRRFFDAQRGLLAVLLLLASPQFVLTHATQLSQPSSTLCMLAGLWAVLHLVDEPRARWSALAGVAFGLGVLVRPMPGVLFVGVALLAGSVALWRRQPRPTLALSTRLLLSAAPGLALGAGSLLWVNHAQSGAVATTGYLTLHGSYGAFSTNGQAIANSLGAALLRQSFWLFGWPCSLVFVPFARPRQNAWLLWGLVLADYAYRILVPKTVFATTGPIYVFEAVPLLALLTADGVRNALRRVEQAPRTRVRAQFASAMLAASVVGLLCFLPVQLRVLVTGSATRERVYQLLARAGAKRALVFANELVLAQRAVTWAYWPPNPSPSLDEELIFVRLPPGAHGLLAAYGFWQHHYPDRRAFLYRDTLGGVRFAELTADQPPSQSATSDDLPAAPTPATTR
ncbi:MAG TPA: glycosyltransferase family 39 protein [Polyangiales bacterium]